MSYRGAHLEANRGANRGANLGATYVVMVISEQVPVNLHPLSGGCGTLPPCCSGFICCSVVSTL